MWFILPILTVCEEGKGDSDRITGISTRLWGLT